MEIRKALTNITLKLRKQRNISKYVFVSKQFTSYHYIIQCYSNAYKSYVPLIVTDFMKELYTILSGVSAWIIFTWLHHLVLSFAAKLSILIQIRDKMNVINLK